MENIGIKNKEDFEIYLKNFNLEYEEVKRKLTIEAMWNRLIYKKYNDKININEDKLKKSLSDKIKIFESNLKDKKPWIFND